MTIARRRAAYGFDHRPLPRPRRPAPLRRRAPGAAPRRPPGSAWRSTPSPRPRSERPDHPESHRLLAYALLRRGRATQRRSPPSSAGMHRRYPEGRFARRAPASCAEDVGPRSARRGSRPSPSAPTRSSPSVRAEGGTVEDEPSIRFVLNWETDANDVDFHIFDAEGGHAFYSQTTLASGGELYADVTTGYGPECFTIRADPARARGALQAPGALLLARADGLRHGQARDHRARRQGRAHASRSGPSW